ncbi:MAG TPA: acyl carrier protein [Chloroflexota bacterium]|jgi:acyl carrier protein
MNGNADQIRELIARQLGIHEVGINDRLVEDLGAESIDLVTIIAVIEETYGVAIDEERLPLLRTAADLSAELARLHATGGD